MDINKLDKFIKEKYQVSFLNNSKWEKLLVCVTEISEEVYVNYKLVYEDKVKSSSFVVPDVSPFFVEPTIYKEVEWIEFPEEYEGNVSDENLKAGKRIYSQNVDEYKQAIMSLGKFELESTSVGFRVFAYK